MHTVSDLWRQLREDPAHRVESKLVIAGVEYGEDRIVRDSLRVYGALYEEFGIGSCCARQIDFSIYPQGDIPRQAKIQVFVRLRTETQASEWIPKGEFFFSTRAPDRVTGVLSVHGYDAMLKTEEVWLDETYASRSWPMEPWTAVNDIAYRIGVAVDTRTVLDPASLVQYPADEEGDMTMREVLGRVAVANAGNWVISDEGKLLLVGLNSIPPETNYLITGDNSAITFGGVRILV